MAERRMFAKTIIDSDAFIDMPLSTQALYFHLSMRADDDGFINNPKKIQRMIGASDDDAKLLILKKFLIPFESGVVVIKHWKIHNYIRNDRYKPTMYLEEKAMLETKDNNGYTLKNEPGIPNGYQMDTQDRLELGKSKDSIEIDCLGSAEAKPTTKKFKKPTIEEVQQYCNERNNNIKAEQFIDYYEANGWKVGKNSMKDWKAAIRTWERRNDTKPTRKEIVPSWMDKKIEKEPMTQQELEEIEEALKEFDPKPSDLESRKQALIKEIEEQYGKR